MEMSSLDILLNIFFWGFHRRITVTLYKKCWSVRFPQDDCVIQSWVWIELTCITKDGLTYTNTSAWPVEAQDIWEQEMQAVKCGRTAVMRTQTSLRGRREPSATRCWNVLHKWDLTYAYWVFYMPVRIYASDPKVVFMTLWAWIKQPESLRETLDSKSPSMFLTTGFPRKKEWIYK